MSESRGYVHCAHRYCFAIIIGRDGDLCDDCLEFSDPGDDGCMSCNGCDNDSDIQLQRCEKCGTMVRYSLEEQGEAKCGCGWPTCSGCRRR